MIDWKEWYEKYGLIKTPIEFEFHLDEDDTHLHSEIADGIRIIQINDTQVEFGFEETDDTVAIQAGFTEIKVDKETFEEAVERFHKRQEKMKEIKEKKRKIRSIKRNADNQIERLQQRWNDGEISYNMYKNNAKQLKKDMKKEIKKLRGKE